MKLGKISGLSSLVLSGTLLFSSQLKADSEYNPVILTPPETTVLYDPPQETRSNFRKDTEDITSAMLITWGLLSAGVYLLRYRLAEPIPRPKRTYFGPITS